MRLFLPTLLLTAGCNPQSGAQVQTDSASVPPPAVYSTHGIVESGEEKDGRFQFVLDRVEQRFVLDRRHTPDYASVFEALKGSAESGRGVTLHYAAEDGWVDPTSGKPTYVVRSLRYDGRDFRGTTTRVAPGLTPITEPQMRAHAAFVRGVALAQTHKPAEARPALDAAIEGGLGEKSLAIAYEIRGDILGSMAFELPDRPNEQADRLLVAALADYTAWARIGPRSDDPKFDIASVLSQLGAYEQARKVYSEIKGESFNDRFWREVRIAGQYRLLGNPAEALATLDRLAAATEDASHGMAFRYHRAWTLIELGRFEEAVDELTKGIGAQPDYAWALIKRACAQAQLGRLPQALADQENAVAQLKEDAVGVTPPPSHTRDVEQASEIAAKLRRAMEANAAHPVDVACSDYSWSSSQQPRPRSVLLPPVASWRADASADLGDLGPFAGVRVVGADLVVVEIARELGGVLFLAQPLEAAPRGVSEFLAAFLGEIEVLVDLI